MAKSVKPMEMPLREDFSSEEAWNNAYDAYKDSFDTSQVEDFSDLNIEFTANGEVITTPSMANFSRDIVDILKEKAVNDGLADDPDEVTVELHDPEEHVGAKVFYKGGVEDVNITWAIQEEDYQRILPDGVPVEAFSDDFYDMEKFTELENAAKEYLEFSSGIDDISNINGPDKGSSL